MSERNTIFSDRVEWLGINHDNASGKSDKFYEIIVYANHNGKRFYEVRRWGRYGTTGQTKKIEHFYEREAIKSAKKQIEAKMKKGYTRPVDALTRLAHQLED